MKKILNLTGDRAMNGFRAAIGAMVVGANDNHNNTVLKEVNAKKLTELLKKEHSVKSATAVMTWRAVRRVLEAEGGEFAGVVLGDAPKYITSKLNRKLQKRGMSLFKVTDLK